MESSTKPIDTGQSGEKIIFVNKKKLEVSETTLTGEQILQRADLDPAQYDLFLVRGQKSEKIDPTTAVQMENGLHFNAIPRNVPYGGSDDS